MNHNLASNIEQRVRPEQPAQIPESGPPVHEIPVPYVPPKRISKSALQENSRILLFGAGMVLVLLLLTLAGISHRTRVAPKKRIELNKSTQAQADGDAPIESVTPILEADSTPKRESTGNYVSPDQVRLSATKSPKPSPARDLGSIPPFDPTEQWPPAQDRPAPPHDNQSGTRVIPTAAGSKAESEILGRSSLIFVRSTAASGAAPKSPGIDKSPALQINLAPGTRLLARLETAVTTAVHTPVVAVVEYNYEYHGQIAVPAGAKAFGHLESADRSGYMAIRFDSLLMPDGSSAEIEASATDLELRPPRGTVEGKHSSKNILVRSVAGIGQAAATLVGRGSLNQPFSQEDVLRGRVVENLGQASDQALTNGRVTEHVVVSLPADTEIYLVLQKGTKDPVQSHASSAVEPASRLEIQELRQLLQLQRELNQPAAAARAEQ